MTATTLRRTGALLVSASLLASLTVASVAAPASAAKPKCAGKTATIVGTNKGEVIKGTKKADVIVAKGGHDIIYGRGGNDTICGGGGHDKLVGAAGKDLLFGQFGRDKLFGGAGRDRLLGGPANDRLAGGPGNDACLQGSGIGLRVGCERPALVPVPVPVAPPPPKVLAVAYTDLNNNHVFDAADVLISKLVDTNGDLGPSPGDTIVMGRYPTNLAASAFGDWLDKSHVVASIGPVSATVVNVRATGGGHHTWFGRKTGSNQSESYVEQLPMSSIQDGLVGGEADAIEVIAGSPSTPQTPVPITSLVNNTDDGFIDVVLNY
jgi:Ca2+-binding RTX toxin-like protein